MTTETCPGVKGHGLNNVPGARYDLGAHVESALAVFASAADYMQTLKCDNKVAANHIASLIEGGSELLKLAQADIDNLEKQLITP